MIGDSMSLEAKSLRRRIPTFFFLVALTLVVGYCSTILRPPRPMFAWRYMYHPDRPTLPAWRFEPPMIDENGTDAIVDTELNLIVVCTPSAVVTSLRWHYPVDDNGFINVGTSTVSKPEEVLHVIDGRLRDTPKVRGRRNEIILRAPDGTWHDHSLRPDVASAFREVYGPGGVDDLRSLLVIACSGDEELQRWLASVWPEE